MATETRALPAKLPWVVLAKANGAGEENLRLQERYARLVFFPHPGADARCVAYVHQLTAAAGARGLGRAYDRDRARGRGAGGGAALQAEARGVTVLVDRAEAAGARARVEVDAESAAILVADRFGDIWHGYDLGAGHAFPDVRELEAWLRYLGTMCPE